MALDPNLLMTILGQSQPTAAIPGATPPFTPTLPAPMTPAGAIPTPGPRDEDILQDIISGRYNPVEEPEAPSKGQRIGLAIADALRAYASIRSGQGLPSETLSGQAQSRREQAANRKTQGNVARVRAQIEERERKAKEAQEAGETARAERRLEIDEAENKRKAREIADGKIADQVELAAALKAYDIDTDTLDLTQVPDQAWAKGRIMRAKMDEEQANKLALTRAAHEGDDETATDRKASRALKEEFTSDIEEIEDDLGSLPSFPDPEAIRKKFYRRVKRRFKGADAADLIEQFEMVNGPAIDAEMKKRQAQRTAGQQQAMTPAFPPVNLGPMGGVQQIPDLLQLLGERIGYGQR